MESERMKGDPWKCRLGFHERKMEKDPLETFPFYYMECSRCHGRWEGIANGRWKRLY